MSFQSEGYHFVVLCYSILCLMCIIIWTKTYVKIVQIKIIKKKWQYFHLFAKLRELPHYMYSDVIDVWIGSLFSLKVLSFVFEIFQKSHIMINYSGNWATLKLRIHDKFITQLQASSVSKRKKIVSLFSFKLLSFDVNQSNSLSMRHS